jgi:hypothetical protein
VCGGEAGDDDRLARSMTARYVTDSAAGGV